MPGPSRYNRKLKARNDAQKTAASKGGRTASEAAFGRSQKAAGRAVSATNLQAPKPKKVKAVRQPSIIKALQLPQVQDRIEKLREKYTPEGRTYQEAIRRDQGVVSRKETALDKVAAEQVKPSRAESRTDFLARQNAAKVNTTLSDDGASVERFRGQEIVGLPSIGAVKKAAREGTLGRQGKRLTTPQVRRVQGKVRRAKRELRKARNATRTPKKNLMRAGLDAEQAQVLATVLNVGRKRGATKKEMLAAVETALVESNVRNLGYGDSDSLGWRQERASVYPGKDLLDVKAAANRFFDESVTDANRGPGMTAGQLAQAIQASAYPDRYDERKGEAVPLLRAFNSAGNASPKARARLDRAKARAAAMDRKAAGLGLTEGVGGESEDRYRGPLPDNATVWPLAIKGTMGGGPEDHATRAFYNWQSDNAVDINVPVGTPVRAIKDGVISQVSGSAPNHSANPAGWNVYLKDKDGVEYFYAHLEEYSVKVGDKVKAGQEIAKSGAANGVAHLHFATPYKLDPRDALKGATTRTSAPKPLPGKFKGARKAVSRLLGQPVWGDHMPFEGGRGGPDETEGSHSTGGFHDLANSYAQDIGSSGGREEEGEGGLGYDQATMDKITRGLRKMGSSVGKLQLGQDHRETLPNGYEVELLTSPESGHGDHIHIGMKWVGGGGDTATSTSGGGSSYIPPSGGGTATPTSGGGRGPASKKRRQTSVLEQLRKLGYNITSSGIRRSGLADSYDIEAPESISTIKSRYGVK